MQLERKWDFPRTLSRISQILNANEYDRLINEISCLCTEARHIINELRKDCFDAVLEILDDDEVFAQKILEAAKEHESDGIPSSQCYFKFVDYVAKIENKCSNEELFALQSKIDAIELLKNLNSAELAEVFKKLNSDTVTEAFLIKKLMPTSVDKNFTLEVASEIARETREKHGEQLFSEDVVEFVDNIIYNFFENQNEKLEAELKVSQQKIIRKDNK